MDESNFKGLLVEGRREGKGIQLYENGDVYEGDWKNDKREGNGKLTMKESYYDGEWKNG
jgi:hypothetical protein